MGVRSVGLQLEAWPEGASRIVVDIGGSGARYASLTPSGEVGNIQRAHLTSLDGLVRTVRELDAQPRWLGLSVPGRLSADSSEVLACSTAPWLVGPLVASLREELSCPISMLNDGAAHALALRGVPDVKMGAICLSIGTSVGFGVLSESGELQPTPAGRNWEIGDLQLQTTASRKELWWAAGEPGLEELIARLGKEDGLRRFGYRLGAMARILVHVLQPPTVGFSGGTVARYWHVLELGIRRELKHSLVGGETPAIVASSQVEPALYGMSLIAPA